MVTEDYVTFEQAKKLEEKGFPQKIDIHICSTVYANKHVLINPLIDKILSGIVVENEEYLAPTLSLVQKWLRKEKDIYITIAHHPSIVDSKWICKCFTPAVYIQDNSYILNEEDAYENIICWN